MEGIGYENSKRFQAVTTDCRNRAQRVSQSRKGRKDFPEKRAKKSDCDHRGHWVYASANLVIFGYPIVLIFSSLLFSSLLFSSVRKIFAFLASWRDFFPAPEPRNEQRPHHDKNRPNRVKMPAPITSPAHGIPPGLIPLARSFLNLCPK